MKPTLLVVGHSSALSGAELNLLRTLPGLDSFHTRVVLGEKGPLVEALKEQGVPVEVLTLPSSALAWRASDTTSAWRRVKGALGLIIYAIRLSVHVAKLRPDLIYTNSAKAHVYGSLVGRLIGRPVVCHIHDRLAPDLMSRFNMALMKLVTRRLTTAIIANSQATLDTVNRGNKTAAIIPCALQSDIPRRVGSVDTHVKFVLPGRISPWKGQEMAIRAFQKATRHLPVGSTLDIIGDSLFGESDYKQDLKRQIDEMGLGDRVKLRGHVHEAPNELQFYDVLIHSSIVPEPFGQVVTEGLAAGLPVIAAAAGGPAEIITDGHDGFLYTMADVDCLAGAIVRLGSSPDLRSRLAMNGIKTAEKYSAQSVVPVLQDFLKSLVTKNTRETE